MLADVSPSGGRHVLVLFAAPLPWRELRDVVRALALRYPAIDPAPMCVPRRPDQPSWRPPQERRLAAALDAARRRHGGRRAPERAGGMGRPAGLSSRPSCATSNCRPRWNPDCQAELDDTGVPWVPRLGGRAPLGAELEHTARTGRWDRSRYPGRSEARMAVLGAAAARGWRLADVRSAIASGAWNGLAALYERRSEPGRLDRLLPLEWRKSDRLRLPGRKTCAIGPLATSVSRPPVAERPSRRSTD